MFVREYGRAGAPVVVLHGGPAAVGDVAPLARALGESFLALEPWQRGSGSEPLTVAKHVEDLHALIRTRSRDAAPAVVGHSWGAMLALCYAAAHPDAAGPIVLVGCGTFDRESRETMKRTFAERTGEELRRRIDELVATEPDPAERHMKTFRLTRGLSAFDLVEPWPDDLEYDGLDLRAHDETWRDMLRLQDDGTYPRAFAAIRSPVLMLHGDYDPHPGRMIRESLRPFVPQLDYRELERCGHTPWLERHARDEFLAILRSWLALRLAEAGPAP